VWANSIVEGLHSDSARRRADQLRNRTGRIDLSKCGGTKFRGEFEDRLKAVLKEITNRTARSSASSTNCTRWSARAAPKAIECGQHAKPVAGASGPLFIGRPAQFFFQSLDRVMEPFSLFQRSLRPDHRASAPVRLLYDEDALSTPSFSRFSAWRSISSCETRRSMVSISIACCRSAS